MSFGQETLVFYKPRTKDAYGDPSGAATVAFTIEGCIVYPGTAVEDANRSATLTTELIALVPPTSNTITASMTAIWRSDEYKIEGKPGRWTFLDGEDAGTQLTLKEAKH